MQQQIRIGTRGSPLALAQTQLVVDALRQLNIDTTTVVIKTTGDIITHKPLYDIGGKGLFAKEIEQAILENRIDIAVHSLKDLESHLHQDIIIGAVLPREAANDVLITPNNIKFEELRQGARIGTCSPRRRAFLKHYRPDLDIIPIRGNIETRINKITELNLDGIVLAAAGINRLKISNCSYRYFDLNYMIPAVGQGTIAIQCHIKSANIFQLLQKLNCQTTWNCITAERQMLAELNGNCRTPIAGFAQLRTDGIITMDAMLADEDGGNMVIHQEIGSDPIQLGVLIAKTLKSKLKSND